MLSKNNATVENIKVTGNVVGNNDVSGVINKIDGSGKLVTLHLSVKVHAAGNRGGYLTGIVGENWKGIVEEKAMLMLKSQVTKLKLPELYIHLKTVQQQYFR